MLKEERIQLLCCSFGREMVLEAIREELDSLRELVSRGEESRIIQALDTWLDRVEERVREASDCSLKKVYNASGIILHTNLGRAPLGKFQIEAAVQAMEGYCNLEYDLETGQRGKRWEHYADTIAKVTGAEGAVAVNNNAAAVTMLLSALTKGKEVLVSRGELVEIGGRFRIPEVMEQSGAVLKEIGTTNRTRISDYEKGITEETGALLKVHTSNYRIIGFTEEVSVEELADLGRRYQLPVIVDLGSGVLVNLEKFGLAHEPTVRETLEKGADLVCFSGDKLLGGPQAGIIAGRRKYIQAMENHPLMRAFRLDKCTIGVLTATFREYLDEERAVKSIPVLQMISRSCETLQAQAEEICGELKKLSCSAEIQAEPSVSMMGGGSLPLEKIPSWAVTLRSGEGSCEQLAECLRKLPIPVITHIKNEKVWLDMRTVISEEKEGFLKELVDFFQNEKKTEPISLADACGNRTHPGRD